MNRDGSFPTTWQAQPHAPMPRVLTSADPLPTLVGVALCHADPQTLFQRQSVQRSSIGADEAHTATGNLGQMIRSSTWRLYAGSTASLLR